MTIKAQEPAGEGEGRDPVFERGRERSEVEAGPGDAGKDPAEDVRRPVRDFWVSVHGPRAADFEKVFGSSTVAVQSPGTRLAKLPGFDKPQEVYLLDLDWAAEQGRRDALVEHLAQRFGIPAADVDRTLDQEGVPILASDTTVAIHNPQRWIG
jgi:hypothetical protein